MEIETENIFKIQTEHINQAVKLIENRISEIIKTAKERNNNSYDEERNMAVSLFIVRSLQEYKDTLSFIENEISNLDHRRHIFALAHMRTLLDIYAKFLHLFENCKDNTHRAMTCIACQLFTYRFLKNQEVYDITKNQYRNFLSKETLKFPLLAIDLSSSWIRKNGLRFADRDKLLTEQLIKKYSIFTIETFGSKKTYEIYSFFSESIHGNPYLSTKQIIHNERFWLTSLSISTSAFLIELIDEFIRKKRQPVDFRLWLSDIKKNKNDFVLLWKSEMNKKSNSKNMF